MNTAAQTHTIREQSLLFLGTFGSLTSRQLAKVLYGAASPKWETHLRYVQRILHSLVASELVVALPGRFVTMPNVYTLTGKGYTYTTALGLPQRRRIRPSEETEKAHNVYFLAHTLAVTDVLIAAQLLSQTHPGIQLTRLYTERDLKRKIFVTLSERTICLEPDASLEFLVHEEWQDLFHLELYRNLPPADWRFKQKVISYVTAVNTGQHEALFQTPALSIAVIAQTEPMAATLKQWAEEALTEMHLPEEGERFFFRYVHVSSVNPEELFLAPDWERAFGTTKTPLLVLE